MKFVFCYLFFIKVSLSFFFSFFVLFIKFLFLLFIKFLFCYYMFFSLSFCFLFTFLFLFIKFLFVLNYSLSLCFHYLYIMFCPPPTPHPQDLPLLYHQNIYSQSSIHHRHPWFLSKNLVTGFEHIGLCWICFKYFRPPGTQEVLSPVQSSIPTSHPCSFSCSSLYAADKLQNTFIKKNSYIF